MNFSYNVTAPDLPYFGRRQVLEAGRLWMYKKGEERNIECVRPVPVYAADPKLKQCDPYHPCKERYHKV